MSRESIKDIKRDSSITEVLRVQDKLVKERIDNGMSPKDAAQRTIKEIQDRTGKSHDKQFKVRV